jgi:hypothetical protein
MVFNSHPHHTARFPSCDSYFVESQDCDFRVDAQDHAKFVARERQLAMAEELSRLASHEYQEDILSHMEQMDVSCAVHVYSLLELTHTLGCHTCGRGLYRYSNRDPVVHEAIPP